MSRALRTLRFTGTVTHCATRFKPGWEEAIAIAEPFANWVVTVEVDGADADVPYQAGEKGSFLFHSPTHVFVFAMDTADAAAQDWCLGRRFRFAVDREDGARGPEYTNLRAELVLPATGA
jgi:hypothetical protein